MRPDAGMTLPATLGLIVIGTLGALMLFQGTDFMIRKAGLARDATSLSYLADSGLEIAKLDIDQRARKVGGAGFSDVLLSGHLASNDHVNAGLVLGERNAVKPRIRQERGAGQLLEVFYFPDIDNADPNGSIAYDDYFPKVYRVISRATNQSRGTVHTAEATVTIRPYSMGTISYGVLSDGLPAPLTRYAFSNRTSWKGRVYFGLDPTKLEMDEDGFYHFDSLVIFGKALPSGMTHPFLYYPTQSFLFEKGYVTDQALPIDLTKAYSDATSLGTTNLSGLGESDVCLRFNNNGTTSRYECDVDTPYPRRRYLGETSETSGSVLDTYSGNQTFTCSGCNIHVKGIYKASITVVAENIFIEGDLVNDDQSDASPYFLSLIARNDVVIPAGSPRIGVWNQAAVLYEDDVLAHPTHNVTNFVPSSSDRDTGDPTYYYANRYYMGPQGHQNHVDILDTDAAIFAGNTVKIDGIWNFGDFSESTSYAMVMDINGNRWDGMASPSSGNPQSYYYMDGSTKRRRADPLACDGGIAPSSCTVGKELARSKMYSWWNHGSLIMGKYSNVRMHYNGMCCQGFWRPQFRSDPRFSYRPPMGFPKSTLVTTEMSELKTYSGASSRLQDLGV